MPVKKDKRTNREVSRREGEEKPGCGVYLDTTEATYVHTHQTEAH